MLEEESLVGFMVLKFIIRKNADNIPRSKKLASRLTVVFGIPSKKTTPPERFRMVGASCARKSSTF